MSDDSDSWYVGEERDNLKKKVTKLERELARFKTASMCELAGENTNLRHYMEHWEGRALKAENELTECKKQLADCDIQYHAIITKRNKQSKFELTKEQAEKINKFHPKCKKKYTGAIGVGGEHRFTQTSVGMIVEYVCICGKKLDLTDYNW